MNILTRICESENIHIRVVPKDNTEMYKQIVSCGGAMAIDNLSGDKFIFLSQNQKHLGTKDLHRTRIGTSYFRPFEER